MVPEVYGEAAAVNATCRCGHARSFHQHYRPGSDCSSCDCPRYRWWPLAILAGRGEDDFEEHADQACAITHPEETR